MPVVEEFRAVKPLTTPVLFLIFNRLDTTKKVFEQIRKAKPPRLYIASDGPRAHKEGEDKVVQTVRDYVLNNIDWDCEVKTLFREKNLGCGRAVSEAITWFFENEEMGIILEDDCAPSLSFFWFCEELLDRYKNDMRVWHIGGCNFQDGIWRGDGDYYLSIYNHVWGWAGWADRWKKYDLELNTFSDSKFIDKIFQEKKAIKYWKRIFKLMKSRKIDTWTYQYTFSMWNNNGLAILPNANMVSNIGFGIDATHTKTVSELANMRTYDLVIKEHPSKVIRDIEADNHTFKIVFLPKPFLFRIINKIKRVLIYRTKK